MPHPMCGCKGVTFRLKQHKASAPLMWVYPDFLPEIDQVLATLPQQPIPQTDPQTDPKANP
jgi:hypothetical protein